MKELLMIGPPVYWVVKPGLNLSQENVQDILCGGRGCSKDSISTQLYQASKFSDV